MSTRSYICKEQPDGSYIGIYCHSDGYLTYNGAMLQDHYNTPEKVDELIGLGNISLLAEKANPDPSKPHSFDYDKRQDDVTVAYGRDRGEKGQEARPISLDTLNEDIWVEYTYVFGQDGKWRYFEHDQLKHGMIPIDEGLAKEYSSLGIEKPEGYYGYFTDATLRQIKEEQSLKKAVM